MLCGFLNFLCFVLAGLYGIGVLLLLISSISCGRSITVRFFHLGLLISSFLDWVLFISRASDWSLHLGCVVLMFFFFFFNLFVFCLSEIDRNPIHIQITLTFISHFELFC